MPSRTNSRAASTARNEILEMLKEDHKKVKKAYRDFNKLDPEDDADRCESLVRQVLADLEVHAALEEELLYPAARDAISEPDMIDEAEVEHESAHALINQLKQMDVDDEKFFARFTVLCEYVLHHIKEEEGELFPQLQQAKLDWESLNREMQAQRAELSPPEPAYPEASGDDSERGSPASKGGNTPAGNRPRGSVEGKTAEPGEAVTSRRI